jgi:hypothetical protein
LTSPTFSPTSDVSHGTALNNYNLSRKKHWDASGDPKSGPRKSSRPHPLNHSSWRGRPTLIRSSDDGAVATNTPCINKPSTFVVDDCQRGQHIDHNATTEKGHELPANGLPIGEEGESFTPRQITWAATLKDSKIESTKHARLLRFNSASSYMVEVCIKTTWWARDWYTASSTSGFQYM